MIPHKLAHYELLDEVGHGGMGIVYLARDTRLDRPVAIKVLPAPVSSDGGRKARFLREARAAAKLNHPNIATIYEIGETAFQDPVTGEPVDGLYIAMEYVDGEDLEPRLTRGELSIEDTIAFAIQIADGLEAAHRAGVIHRDLKPHNIRITPENKVKIVDFGLAKILLAEDSGAEPAPSELHTKAGMIVGTIPYMAPEQVQGGKVDSRTDLFAFGVVLYRMITGRLPFPGDNLIVYVKALTGDRPEAMSRSRPEVSPDLDRIVAKLLAPDPDDRYQSAGEVKADLTWLRASDITLPMRRPALAEPRSRRRWALFLSSGLLLVLTAALLGFWATWESPQTLLLPPFESSGAEGQAEHLCHSVRHELGSLLSETLIVVIYPSPDERPPKAAVSLQGECSSYNGEAQVAITLIHTESRALLLSETYPLRAGFEREIGQQLLRALEVALSPRQRLRLKRRSADSVKAFHLYVEGLEELGNSADPRNYEKAANAFDRAIRLDKHFVEAYTGLSEALLRGYASTKDPADLKHAKLMAQEADALDPEAAKLARALIERHLQNYEASIKLLEEMAALSPSPGIYKELAITQIKNRQFEKAASNLQRAIDLRPNYWFYWNHLGALWVTADAPEKARKSFEEARRLAPPGVTDPAVNLGALDLLAGRYEAALEAYREIPEQLMTHELAANKGAALLSLRRPLEAAAEFDTAIELLPTEPTHRMSLGDAFYLQGKQAEAQEAYAQALAMAEKQVAANHGDERATTVRAQCLARLGRCADIELEVEAVRALSPPSSETHLTLSKILALCSRKEAALQELRKAVKQGLPPLRLQGEYELDVLQGDPAFASLTAGTGGSASP